MGGVERGVRRVVRRRARARTARNCPPAVADVSRARGERRPARRDRARAGDVAAQPVRDSRDARPARSSCSICSAAPSFRSPSNARCTASRSATSPSCGSSAWPARSGSARTFIYHPKAARARDRRARARDAREGCEPARRDRSRSRSCATQVIALPPHAGRARLRARLADHGMNRLALVAALVPRECRARADPPVMRPEAIEARSRHARRPAGRASFDGGAPVGAWAAGVTLGYLERPLELHTLVRATYPIESSRDRRRSAARSRSAIASIVDARLPFEHQVGDAARAASATRRRSQRFALGDLGLGARLHVAGFGPGAACSCASTVDAADRR